MGIVAKDSVKHIVLECVHCKQIFSNLKDSDQHVKETHHRIKARFQCPKCDKFFGNYQILHLHLRVHDSEDPKGNMCHVSDRHIPEIKHSESKNTSQNPLTEQEEIQNNVNDTNTASSVEPVFQPAKKGVGLTKIRLEDCLRCDECSCIYIDENDYNKHMKNFHRTNSNRKTKQKKGCRSCCKQCNCQGNHPPPMTRNENTTITTTTTHNNNLFQFNIKDRWTKMVSCRLNTTEAKYDVIPNIKREIKPDPDGFSSGMPNIIDYSHLLSQVEVKIKTEPVDNSDEFSY